MAGPDLAGSHVERGKEGGRAVPGIVMAVSGEGAAVLELEIALRPFQGLDVRLLVDRALAEARPPWRGRSSRPDSPSSAKRMRQWLTVRGIVPRSRAIARVDKPSAAISTIRARNTCRCSLVGARSQASSSARSSGPSRTSLASENIPHDES